MIERVQCIVVSSQGCLGLVQAGKGFAMLSTDVEFDETPAEAAHRVARTAVGRAARFENVVLLNSLRDEQDESMHYTFVVRVIQSAMQLTPLRGFQWLTPSYRQALEELHPQLLGEGVASTYRRAVGTARQSV